MTRINLVPASQLFDQHLIAEHRELKRIPNQIREGKIKPNPSKIPNKFCLGKGHVMFFVDKLGFLRERYIELLNECKHRGFAVSDYSNVFEGLPNDLFNSYSPTKEDIELSKSRINSKYRINFYRYKGVIV